MTCLMSNESIGLHFIMHVSPCISDVLVLVVFESLGFHIKFLGLLLVVD